MFLMKEMKKMHISVVATHWNKIILWSDSSLDSCHSRNYGEVYHFVSNFINIINIKLYVMLEGARSFARLFAPLGANSKKTTKHVCNKILLTVSI